MDQQSHTTKKPPTSVALERHYTPKELAVRWGLSARFIRELFEREEGVLTINRPEKMHKRKYVTLRIPESVVDRVHQRLMTRKRPTLSAVASSPDPLVARRQA